MIFINWREKLPTGFENLDINDQCSIVSKILDEAGYISYYDEYPFEADIKENNPPKSLLRYLAKDSIETAVHLIKAYNGEDKPELLRLMLNELEWEDDVSVEKLVTAIATDKYFNETIAEDLIAYIGSGWLFLIADAVIDICKKKLPTNLITFLWEEAKHNGGCMLGDVAQCPNLPENIIHEMVDLFKRLDPKEEYEQEAKEYFCECLVGNPAVPKDIKSELSTWLNTLK